MRPRSSLSVEGVASVRAVALAVAVAVTATTVRAPAAEPTAAEIAAARELFDEGIALEEKGQWQEALERFRKVAAVKTTPAVRFHLGLCLEKLGRLVDALVEFQRAHADAGVDPSSQNVAASAAKHVADLKERIPRLIVRVPQGVEAPSVAIDGAPVNASLVGTPIPVDPGVHVVRVTAKDRAPFSTEVTLVERGQPVTVEASLPELGAGPKPQPTEPELPEAPPSPTTGPGALPWVFGGVGAAALVTGGVMYLLRQSTIRELESACVDGRTQCPEDKRDVADRGRAYTTAGNVLVGVGVLGVATALVLVAAAPSAPKPSSAATSGPRVTVGSGPGTFGIGVLATF